MLKRCRFFNLEYAQTALNLRSKQVLRLLVNHTNLCNVHWSGNITIYPDSFLFLHQNLIEGRCVHINFLPLFVCRRLWLDSAVLRTPRLVYLTQHWLSHCKISIQSSVNQVIDLISSIHFIKVVLTCRAAALPMHRNFRLLHWHLLRKLNSLCFDVWVLSRIQRWSCWSKGCLGNLNRRLRITFLE